MKGIRLYILFVFMICSGTVSSQNEENRSPKEHRNMAVEAERLNDPYQAIDHYEKYLEVVNEDASARYRLAENYRKARDYKKAAENYEKAYLSKPSKYSKALFYQAQMLHSMGEYEEAMVLYEKFRDEYRGEKDAYEIRRLAKSAAEGCQLALADSLKNNVLISHLNSSINKSHIESSPIYYADKLLFSSLPMEGLEYFPLEADSVPKRLFYQASEENGHWQNLGLWKDVEFPDAANISSGAFSPDGQRFYFSVCKMGFLEKMICQIWMSEKTGDKWSEPLALSANINNPRFTSTQPAVGTDYKGREVLYFVSDREEGKGGLDIWYSRYRDRNGEFDEARNCGSKINSEGDEMSPFVHPKNRNLYFSSTGHPGYGGLDVFKSSGERGKWIDPTNIGSPINSPTDELYFVLNEKGEKGIFASNRKESVPLKNQSCCDDLYEFVYTDFIELNVKGAVLSSESRGKMQDVGLGLYLLPKEPIATEGGQEEEAEAEILLKKINSSDGAFEFSLEAGNKYVIKAKKEGYLLEELHISTENLKKSAEIIKTINLDKLPFQSMVIENIYYEFDDSKLTEEAKITIDTTILPIMINNPEIVAEISSHTDDKGTEGYNEHLSQKRAESVVKYLRSKGVSKERMQAKGYGESVPIAKNENEDGSDNPEGRAKNRRTEFKVIGVVEVFEEEE